jgi:hypothetical protein
MILAPFLILRKYLILDFDARFRYLLSGNLGTRRGCVNMRTYLKNASNAQ